MTHEPPEYPIQRYLEAWRDNLLDTFAREEEAKQRAKAETALAEDCVLVKEMLLDFDQVTRLHNIAAADLLAKLSDPEFLQKVEQANKALRLSGRLADMKAQTLRDREMSRLTSETDSEVSVERSIRLAELGIKSRGKGPGAA